MRSDLRALLMAIEWLLVLAISILPMAALYAVRSGWVGLEFGVLLLLASLCYFLLLGTGEGESVAMLVEENDQEFDIGGDDW